MRRWMRDENREGYREISYGREDLRDSQKNYNKLAYEDFKQIESPLDWDVYFESMGLAGLKELDAKQINFYKDMNKALQNTTVDEQNIIWRLIY